MAHAQMREITYLCTSRLCGYVRCSFPLTFEMQVIPRKFFPANSLLSLLADDGTVSALLDSFGLQEYTYLFSNKPAQCLDYTIVKGASSRMLPAPAKSTVAGRCDVCHSQNGQAGDPRCRLAGG